ncbi:PEP-CTERM sorting domain-containing protein [Planctomycetota bacterium]|nr:PEP-CTERM sorting domain-containing protein [Planctomycetota bacterium]
MLKQWVNGTLTGLCAVGLMGAIGTGEVSGAIYEVTVVNDYVEDYDDGDAVDFGLLNGMKIMFTLDVSELVEESIDSGFYPQPYSTAEYSGFTVNRVYGLMGDEMVLLMNELDGLAALNHEAKTTDDELKSVSLGGGEFLEVELLWEADPWVSGFDDMFTGDDVLSFESGFMPMFADEDGRDDLYAYASLLFANDAGYVEGMMSSFVEIDALPALPEPASALLMGLSGLAILRRRNRC